MHGVIKNRERSGLARNFQSSLKSGLSLDSAQEEQEKGQNGQRFFGINSSGL